MDRPYTLLKELKAPSTQPVNCMLFSQNAKHLLVAGDAEKVWVWNVESFQREQVLEDANWGQVTCMAWIYPDIPNQDGGATLCVGNARGSLSLYPMDPREVKPFSRTPTQIGVFRFNDPVEKLSFDKLNRRLAVASHAGEIKMYDAASGSLSLLWEDKTVGSIPSSLLFYGGANQNLLTTSLESSEICCRNASNNAVSWKKTVTGGIGFATMTSDETLLVVNNLTTGNFDVYNVSEGAPLRSLPVGSRRRYVKQCQFFEGSKIVVCGSDKNKVHVIDVVQNYVVQTLTAGKGIAPSFNFWIWAPAPLAEQAMMQTVAVTPASSRRVIIAGACQGSVYLWEKEQGRASISDSSAYPLLVKLVLWGLQACAVAVVAAWGPHIQQSAMSLWSRMVQPPRAAEPAIAVQTLFVYQTPPVVHNPVVPTPPVVLNPPVQPHVVQPPVVQTPAQVPAQVPVVVQTPLIVQTPLTVQTFATVEAISPVDSGVSPLPMGEGAIVYL